MEDKLEQLLFLHKKYKIELKDLRPGYLSRSPSTNGDYTYSEVVKVGDRYVRRGITRDTQAIYDHGRKRFLQDIMGILETNIKVMRYHKKHYRDIDAAEIIRNLPPAYSHLPLEAFFPRGGRTGWKEGAYVKNSAFPENLRHVTLGGYKVRSKSELYIAGMLDHYRIPYRYEMEIRMEGKAYYPDFTICNPLDGTIIYWEHCGMVGNEKYMDGHYEKIRTYGRNGIGPWKNLIVTYDDEKGNINAMDIRHIIRGLLMKFQMETFI